MVPALGQVSLHGAQISLGNFAECALGSPVSLSSLTRRHIALEEPLILSLLPRARVLAQGTLWERTKEAFLGLQASCQPGHTSALYKRMAIVPTPAPKLPRRPWLVSQCQCCSWHSGASVQESTTNQTHYLIFTAGKRQLGIRLTPFLCPAWASLSVPNSSSFWPTRCKHGHLRH